MNTVFPAGLEKRQRGGRSKIDIKPEKTQRKAEEYSPNVGDRVDQMKWPGNRVKMKKKKSPPQHLTELRKSLLQEKFRKR